MEITKYQGVKNIGNILDTSNITVDKIYVNSKIPYFTISSIQDSDLTETVNNFQLLVSYNIGSFVTLEGVTYTETLAAAINSTRFNFKCINNSDVDYTLIMRKHNTTVSTIWIPKTNVANGFIDEGVFEQYKSKNEFSDATNLPTVMKKLTITDDDESTTTEAIDNYRISFMDATIAYSNATEIANNEYGSIASGKFIYNKTKLYSFGQASFKNAIFPSDADSYIFPMFNIIDLNVANDSLVTVLIPWRDYLLAASKTGIYLITKQDDGYYSKAINTFIGIPEKDWNTCKSILNGIIFKAYKKIYVLQPNSNSSDDTILDIHELSTPIENYLEDDDSKLDNIGFTTEKYYYLMIPNSESNTTSVYKYEYTRHIWMKHKLPIAVNSYIVNSVEDIRLFDAEGKEFYYEKEIQDFTSQKNDIQTRLQYGDALTYSVDKILDLYSKATISDAVIYPIEFSLESGQKTDSISITKQFIETKMLLATLSDKDCFPFTVYVMTDDLTIPVKKDITTDAPFWKDDRTDTAVLNTIIQVNKSNAVNTIRQLVLRYSGRGKTINHIIKGITYSKFKLFVVYYKYKVLPIKQ